MQSSLSLCFLLALFAEARVGNTIPTFEINLDLKPRKRWQQVAKFYRPYIVDHFKTFNLPIEADPWEHDQLQELFANISEEIREEIEGMVEVLNDKIAESASRAAFLRHQIIYELGFTEGFDCSGVVAAKEDGTVVHGRNLDIGSKRLWHDDITFYAKWKRGGKTIAKSIQLCCGVGIHTGIHLSGQGHWTVEHNTRLELNENFFHDVSGQKWAHNTMVAKRNGGKFSHLEARRLFLEKETFTDALDAFTTMPWMVPQYWIFGSSDKYQGAVLTNGRAQPHAHDNFYDIMTMSAGGGNWFLVQTNDDHFGLKYDSRRDTAIDGMKKLQRERPGYGDSDVMAVMRTRPVCNEDTLFSWVVTPSTDVEEYQSGPCLEAKEEA